jgi:hypothetical protein
MLALFVRIFVIAGVLEPRVVEEGVTSIKLTKNKQTLFLYHIA